MPYKCMNCGKIYEDNSKEILTGCSCGSNLFIFKENFEEKTKKEKKETTVKEIDSFIKSLSSGVKAKFKPIIKFDLDSIKVVENGVYKINLKKLLNEPLIVEIKEGKYFIHLASLFKKGKDKYLEPEDLEDDEIKRFKCPKCKKTFSSKRGLKIHLGKIHK